MTPEVSGVQWGAAVRRTIHGVTPALWHPLLHARYPDHQVLRAWPLQGGVSAAVTAVELRAPNGEIRTVVVRQYGEVDHRRNPDIARDEFRLLRRLRSAGLEVPEPLAFGHSEGAGPTPILITEFILGTSEIAPADVAQAAVDLAAFLVRLHRGGWPSADVAFLPRKGALSARPARPDDTLSETVIRDVLERRWPPAPGAEGLVHGDVWPGNLLWHQRTLAAVIDWEDAGIGDPLLDVSNARLELLFFFGKDAMNALTDAYLTRSERDLGALPLWDLYAALRPAGRLHTWGLAPEVEREIRGRHRWFVEQALTLLR